MTEQQKFQPGDKVKVTMELTVVAPEKGIYVSLNRGIIFPLPVQEWADECDNINVELIERPEPTREPGWYLCMYLHYSPSPLRWDGENWNMPYGLGFTPVADLDVTVVSDRITLHEGVEL